MKILKPSSRGIMNGRDQPRGEGYRTRGSQAERSESGCTPAKGGRKIRKICGSHRKQDGNWSRWIFRILLSSLRRVLLITVRLFQSACFKSCFLFIHELRDPTCSIRGRRAVQNIPTAKLSIRYRRNPMLSRTRSWQD